MMIIRIVLNGLIMAAELAAVAGVAWTAHRYPIEFAGGTALLSFLLGLNLEAARLKNELPFYFGRSSSLRVMLVPLIGGIEAMMKAVLAGLAAIFTFAGTNADRLFWVAIIFAITLYVGASTLRVMSLKLDALPSRWGFFRLGPPLGLLFSAGLAVAAAYGLIQASSVGDIGWKLVWELPQKPSLSQVSELFFQLKQAFDDFIVTILRSVLDEGLARIAGVFVSVNVLAGFVASVYAAIIATAVRFAEDRLPG